MSRSGSAASASTPAPSHDPDPARPPTGAVPAGRHRIPARPPPQLSRPGALDQPGQQGTPLQVRSLRRAHPSRGLGRRDAATRPRRRRSLFGNHDLGPVRRLDHAPGDARAGTQNPRSLPLRMAPPGRPDTRPPRTPHGHQRRRRPRRAQLDRRRLQPLDGQEQPRRTRAGDGTSRPATASWTATPPASPAGRASSARPKTNSTIPEPWPSPTGMH